MLEEPKQRKARADRGPRLNDRDYFAIEWIAQQYAICVDHLAILLARLALEKRHEDRQKYDGEITIKRALEVVRRWETLELVERQSFTYEYPAWIWLTSQGLQLAANEVGHFRAYTPVPAKLHHLYWVNHTRLYIDQNPDLEWQSEREIKANYERLQAGEKRSHTPDAIVTDKEKHHIALEVELTPKAYSRLDKILLELATSDDYDLIWYFTLDRATEVVKRAINRLNKGDRSKFSVHPMDDLNLA